MSLVEKFRRYIAHERLFARDDSLLLAVSGGVDSMVLMALMREAGYNFAVAHCNFHLRGAESDGDELLVQEEVGKIGARYHCVHFDTYAEVASTGDSVEMAARRLRYTWFGELCDKYGYSKVVIAHHADDSIETYFINMLRGTGIRGLAGIAPRNGRIVRPLLFATREDILAYARKCGVPFREDSSNNSMRHLRNRIRHEVVPTLKDIAPQFTSLMSRNMALVSDAQRFIDGAMALVKSRVLTETHGIYRVDVASIDSALPRDFVIYEILSSEFGFRREVVNDICLALSGDATGRRFYAPCMEAVVDRGAIVVTPITDGDDVNVAVNEDDSAVAVGDMDFCMQRLSIEEVQSLNQGADVALLDADKVRFPLRIRRWHDGDVMVPLGMRGRKKISDMLVDDKVSLLHKREQYVVVSGDDIVWLVGRRIDNRYALGGQTSRVLRMSVKRS